MKMLVSLIRALLGLPITDETETESENENENEAEAGASIFGNFINGSLQSTDQ